jgi:hypothetical protein
MNSALINEINLSAAAAAVGHNYAWLFTVRGDAAAAVHESEAAADRAAFAIFNRLLLIHDDVDAAEAAFDYAGDASTEA